MEAGGDAGMGVFHPFVRPSHSFLGRIVLMKDRVSAFGLFITFVLLRSGPTPDGEPSDGLYLWATFLGLTSSSLALIQYAPQLWYTYRTKLVGALSIPSMCIQSPGAALMVWTIASKWVHIHLHFRWRS